MKKKRKSPKRKIGGLKAGSSHNKVLYNAVHVELHTTVVEEVFTSLSITNIEEAVKVIGKYFNKKTIASKEQLIAIGLNRGNKKIFVLEISIGNEKMCVMDIHELLRMCIMTKCSGIIIAHNHPSGNINPSQADDNMTKKVREALKVIDVEFMDHFILSPDGRAYSYAAEGRLIIN